MIKKSMDIIDLISWCKNTGKTLENCRVENIYWCGHYWLFKLRCPNKGKTLLKLEPGRRIHLSVVEPGEKGIDRMAAYLRKHIRGCHIDRVEMPWWERIVRISVVCRDKKLYLYNEIIPRGFLVVTDEDNTILYANRFEKLRDREIRVGNTYVPPPHRPCLLEMSDDDLYKLLLKGKDLVRGIVKGWGLPGYIAEEILVRTGLYSKKSEKPDKISVTDIESMRHKLEELINEALNGKGYLVYIDDSLELVTAYKPILYCKIYEANIQEMPTLDEALDPYFSQYEKEVIEKREETRIKDEINRLKKSYEKLVETITKYREKAEKLERISNILQANYPLFEKLLQCINNTREEHGWGKIREKCPGIVSVNPREGKVVIKVQGEPVEIDIRLDAWKNILEMRRKAGELKGKARRAEIEAEKLLEKIKELENKRIRIETKVSKGIRPKYWYEKYHWLFTSEGFLVIGGRDAGQNETIVRKYLAPEDIFLHAEIHGGPATVIKTEGRTPGRKSIEEAAVIAACYSRGWSEGIGALEVFWVKGEQVSKTPPSGEYLAKGAFMVYGKKQFVTVELRLALGVEEIDDPIYGVYQRIIVGPEHLVRQRSLSYVVLAPGDMRGKELAEKIMAILRRKSETTLSVSTDEVMYRLPGPSRIIRAEQGEGARENK